MNNENLVPPGSRGSEKPRGHKQSLFLYFEDPYCNRLNLILIMALINSKLLKILQKVLL